MDDVQHSRHLCLDTDWVRNGQLVLGVRQWTTSRQAVGPTQSPLIRSTNGQDGAQCNSRTHHYSEPGADIFAFSLPERLHTPGAAILSHSLAGQLGRKARVKNLSRQLISKDSFTSWCLSAQIRIPISLPFYHSVSRIAAHNRRCVCHWKTSHPQ